MKTQILLSLFGGAYAGSEILLRQQEEIDEAGRPPIDPPCQVGDARPECQEGPGAMQRRIAPWKIQAINGYGCYCLFDERAMHAYGQPVNEVDEHCQFLNDGYKCAKEQTEVETGEECNPWDEDYDISISDIIWTNPADMGDTDHYGMACVACKTKYSTVCQQRACVIETHFLLKLYFSNNDDLDYQYQHIQPSWVKSDHCQHATHTHPVDGPHHDHPHGPRTRMCCGDYPYVHRHTYEGDREDFACCGNAKITVDTHQCCDNNVIHPAGAACPTL